MVELGMAELLTGGGGLMLLAWGLVRIIDKLIDRSPRTARKGDDPEAVACKASDVDAMYQKRTYEWAESNNNMLKAIHEIVHLKDDNGAHLIYVPRSLELSQKEIVAMLNSLVVTQEKTAYILDRLCTKLDNRPE